MYSVDLIAIAVAFVFGFSVRMVGLPPLVGYLVAGFVLYAAGMENTDTLHNFSEMGVTLLLFSIGLKLNIGSLLMPQIWAVASIHMLVTIVLFSAGIYALGILGLPLFAGVELPVVILVAFALSFSSTVFAVKVLEEKGEAGGLYGRIAIGILIIQDIAAVVFMAFSMGKVPSPWALLLFGLIPLRPVLYRVFDKAGYGELMILFGLTVALGGAKIFETVGVKGDLGALILGVLLASHAHSSELSRQLLGFKDLFLVGFFLTMGLSGPLSWEAVGIALLLVLLVPLKAMLFYSLLTRFDLRARTSMLTSLSLSNYSEFGLIIGAVAVGNGWLGSEWLVVIAIALSLSFIVAAPLNTRSHQLYKRYRDLLKRHESSRRIADEQPIDSGDATVLVFGMGRVGTGAYDSLIRKLPGQVLGVDQDHEIGEAHTASGRRVICSSATDPDFWIRFHLDTRKVRLIMLAMPSYQENKLATQQIRETGYQGPVAAIAKFQDEVELLKQEGIDSVFNLYEEAGGGFADGVLEYLPAGGNAHV